jgi:hypothetical protein
VQRSVLTVLLAATSVVFGACTSIVGPEDESAGVYSLRTVAGMAVPYTLTDDPSIAISGREVTLRLDGTFTDVVELSIVSPSWSGVMPSTRRGTFASDGGSLRLTYGDGRDMRAERVGRTLFLDDTGLIFVLER